LAIFENGRKRFCLISATSVTSTAPTGPTGQHLHHCPQDGELKLFNLTNKVVDVANHQLYTIDIGNNEADAPVFARSTATA
jgi:hypothetical protein